MRIIGSLSTIPLCIVTKGYYYFGLFETFKLCFMYDVFECHSFNWPNPEHFSLNQWPNCWWTSSDTYIIQKCTLVTDFLFGLIYSQFTKKWQFIPVQLCPFANKLATRFEFNSIHLYMNSTRATWNEQRSIQIIKKKKKNKIVQIEWLMSVVHMAIYSMHKVINILYYLLVVPY